MRSGFEKLVVCHLNHQLRGAESDADAAFVRGLAKNCGLRCEIASVDVRAMARKRKLSIETAAREARRDFFRAAARKHRCRALFLAHHADDQAETVLMNLFRGSGLAGLTGMAPRGDHVLEDVTILRPLLDLPRASIDAWARAHEVKFREDASNESLEHTRNRVRHELLPLAADIFKRAPGPLLARFAAIARADDGCLYQLADELLAGAGPQPDGSLRVTDALKAQSPAIIVRVIALWLARQHGFAPHHRELASAIAMLQPGGPAKINLRGARYLRRKEGRLWVS